MKIRSVKRTFAAVVIAAIAAPLAACGGSSDSNNDCTAGTWNHDNNTNTDCVAWTTCPLGDFVSQEPTATNDRECQACPAETFSNNENARDCANWTQCEGEEVELEAGTPSTDRVCGFGWDTISFGTDEFDIAYAIATVPSGGFVITGQTAGVFPGATNAGQSDIFVRRFSAGGATIWTTQFGTESPETAYTVTVDSDNNTYVAGYTGGELAGQQNSGSYDAFLVKLNNLGEVQWTRQFGSTQADFAFGLAATSQGIYGVGEVGAALPQQESGGLSDGFIRKYDVDGEVIWTRQFGSEQKDAAGAIVAVGEDIYIAGSTEGALQGGIGGGSDVNGFVRKLNSNGDVVWTHEFGAGSDSTTQVFALAINPAGGVFAGGASEKMLEGPTTELHNAFVRSYDTNGTVLWTREFGGISESRESVTGLTYVNDVLVVVGYTGGTLAGQQSAGDQDVFFRTYDSSGTMATTVQFGSDLGDSASDVVSDDNGNVYMCGFSEGDFAGQANLGQMDAFVTRLVP